MVFIINLDWNILYIDIYKQQWITNDFQITINPKIKIKLIKVENIEINIVLKWVKYSENNIVHYDWLHLKSYHNSKFYLMGKNVLFNLCGLKKLEKRNN